MVQRKSFFMLSAFFAVFFLPAQFYLKNFKATAANPYQAYLTWTIGGGSVVCTDLQIQVSLDSFQNIKAAYPYPGGVCGGNSSDVDLNYTDNYPDIHKKNYYRLYSSVGGYSPIVYVDFGAINGDYNIYPDPLTDNSIITFDNPNSTNFVMKITNVTGNQYFLYPDIYTSQWPLPKSNFKPGIYFFRLINTSTGTFTRGKFVVTE